MYCSNRMPEGQTIIDSFCVWGERANLGAIAVGCAGIEFSEEQNPAD
jgi:hypothetical protein